MEKTNVPNHQPDINYTFPTKILYFSVVIVTIMDIAFAEDHIALQCFSCTSDKRASAILQWSSTLQPFH